MTVIAYRDGIMAGDSCWSDGGKDGDYGGVAISMFSSGQPGMALTFAAYAVANIGLIWQAGL